MSISTAFVRMRRKVFPSAHDRTYQAWRADRGDETLRLDYDLTEASLVLDLGGYQGQWASDVYARFGCRVLIFEPVPAFADHIEWRFCRNAKVEVYPFALGDCNRSESLYMAADSSSIHSGSGNKIDIEVRDALEFFSSYAIVDCDLMKVNIEGGEYELLPRLIDTGLVSRIRNIQVQFHRIDKASDERMEAIESALSRTHEITYRYRYVWENWRLLAT